VTDGDQSVEDVIAGAYTFQNLGQLNKAYQEWLNIDVRRVMYKKRRIGRKVSFLENRLQDIIQYRHGVVPAIPGDQETSGFQGSPASGFRNAGF
jgi:hypothetical protein